MSWSKQALLLDYSILSTPPDLLGDLDKSLNLSDPYLFSLCWTWSTGGRVIHTSRFMVQLSSLASSLIVLISLLNLQFPTTLPTHPSQRQPFSGA